MFGIIGHAEVGNATGTYRFTEFYSQFSFMKD